MRAASGALWAVACVMLTAIAPGCERPAPGDARRPIRVVASIAPLLWVAERLAPDDAEVSLLTPPGVSPHGWEPPPSAVAAMRSADVLLVVGHGMEPRIEALERAGALGGAAVVRFEGETESDHPHVHGDHSHEGADPHFWLDPVSMRRYVQSAADAIAGAAGTPPVNASRLFEEIERVDEEHRAALAPFVGRRLVTMHNAWAPLAERYGLVIAEVIRPAAGVEPTPGAVAASAAALRGEGGKAPAVLVIEPQFDSSAAERIAAAAGAEVARMDPLGHGDWPEMMRANLAALVAALEGGGG